MKGLGMGVIKWQLGRRDATPEIAGPLRKVSERGEPEVDPLEELIRLVGEADADNVRPQDNAGRSPAIPTELTRRATFRGCAAPAPGDPVSGIERQEHGHKGRKLQVGACAGRV